MVKNIFCIGGANIDRKLKSSANLLPGTSNPVVSNTTFGGVARNVAENLARWTNRVHLQCVVGKDAAGQQLLAHMQKLGVNTDKCFVLENHATSHYYALLNSGGELHIALADMDIYDHIPIETFIQSWNEWSNYTIIFIDTNLPAALIDYALHQAEAKQAKLIIDPVSVPKAKRLPHSLKNVFLIKPNQLEASILTGITIHSVNDCFKAGVALLNRGVENVVISLGNSGYVIVNDSQQEHIQTLQFNDVHDVNGAGDAFIAGILFGLQEDSSILHACELGAAAAAFTVQSHKTVAEEITAAHLRAFIHNKKIITKENEHAAIL